MHTSVPDSREVTFLLGMAGNDGTLNTFLLDFISCWLSNSPWCCLIHYIRISCFPPRFLFILLFFSLALFLFVSLFRSASFSFSLFSCISPSSLFVYFSLSHSFSTSFFFLCILSHFPLFFCSLFIYVFSVFLPVYLFYLSFFLFCFCFFLYLSTVFTCFSICLGVFFSLVFLRLFPSLSISFSLSPYFSLLSPHLSFRRQWSTVNCYTMSGTPYWKAMHNLKQT
jgi:hypothetical protein